MKSVILGLIVCLWLVPANAQVMGGAVSGNVVVNSPAASQQPSQGQKPDAKPGEQQKGTAVVEGNVLTQDGDRPIRKAQVTLMPIVQTTNPMAPPPQQQSETDAAGHYIFKDLPAGQYRLSVQHPQYVGTGRSARFVGQNVSLKDAQEMKDVNFRLVPAAVVRGRVTDEDGDPVPRAQVSVLRSQYIRGHKQTLPAGSGNTDDLGEFRIHGLAPGQYWVSATRQMQFTFGGPNAAQQDTRQYVRTYYPGVTDMKSAATVELKAGDELPVNISLMKSETALVKGTVLGPTGDKPTSGQIFFSNGSDAMPFSGNNATVREGAFETRLPPGHYRATVMTFDQQQPNLQSTSTYEVDVPQQGLPDVKLQTNTPTKVVATVKLENGPPDAKLDNVRVQMMVRREDSFPMFFGGDQGNAKVEKDGTATIEKLNPGTYDANYFGGIKGAEDTYIKSVLQGSRDVLVTGVHVSGSETRVEYVLSADGGNIEGNVTDADHKPIKGVYVVDIPPEEFRSRDQFFRVATTDQAGHFKLNAIRPGRHVVVALDDPEPGIWADPDFIRSVEDKGERFSISAKEKKQVQLTVIPKQQLTAGQ